VWRWLTFLLAIVGVALGIVIGLLNPMPITLDLGLARWSAPTGGLVLLVFGAGLVAGFGLGCLWMIARRGARSRSRSKSAPAQKSPANG